MVLTLVGLGLCDTRDVTLKGYDAICNADYIYLESYTSSLMDTKEQLEAFYGKPIIEADRQLVELQSEELLNRSKDSKVAFLVAGDPFCATTHSDIALRAAVKGITVKVIHNASIMTAIASCGLQMYRFGETVSIPFFDGKWNPSSFYDRIKSNKAADLHTLCLLDIKVKEQSFENLMRGRQVFEPPRYMSVNQALQQLFEIEMLRKENVCDGSSNGFGMARMGADTELILSGTLEELMSANFGEPLHSLIICAPTLHEMEKEFFKLYRTAKVPENN